MAERCFGLSIVFRAALSVDAPYGLPKDKCAGKPLACYCVVLLCRGGLRQFVGLGSPTVLVCVTALASLYNAKGRAVARYACIHQP